MSSFGDTKLRNVGEYIATGVSKGPDHWWEGWVKIWNRYRAKYVTCRNAKITPFIHVALLSVALNYAIEYPHLKAHSRWRKYH